jgi:hypothetical protein
MSEKCYQNARKSCKYGCLVNHDSCYVISNNIWSFNQRKLMKSREANNDFEKDKVMKDVLYNKLREKHVETVKGHIRLEFSLRFDSDDYLSSTKICNLCESCYVIFNNHRCKFFFVFITLIC